MQNNIFTIDFYQTKHSLYIIHKYVHFDCYLIFLTTVLSFRNIFIDIVHCSIFILQLIDQDRSMNDRLCISKVVSDVIYQHYLQLWSSGKEYHVLLKPLNVKSLH